MTGMLSPIFNYFGTMQTPTQRGIFVPSPSQWSHCLSSEPIISRNKPVEQVADPVSVTKRMPSTHSSSEWAEIEKYTGVHGSTAASMQPMLLHVSESL